MVAVTGSADCTTTRAPSAHEKSRAPTVGSGRSGTRYERVHGATMPSVARARGNVTLQN